MTSPTSPSSPMTDDTAARDAAIRRVLRHGHNIDITTTGRRSGLPRRIEITFHSFDGHLYISGMPSEQTRAWLRNLRADPEFTFHLKALLKADLPATAREITDEAGAPRGAGEGRPGLEPPSRADGQVQPARRGHDRGLRPRPPLD